MKKSLLKIAITAGLASSLLNVIPVMAEEPELDYKFRYSAYFACGSAEKGSGGQLAPGSYNTQVNMMNWHGRALQLRKKVAFTYPPRSQTPGVHSAWIGPETIERVHSMSVDCEEIIGSRKNPSEFDMYEGDPVLEDGSDPTFYTGYLVIQATKSLNVTTVVTAGPKSGNKKSDDDDDKEEREDGKKKQSHVKSISVTNVPERIRAESQQHGDEGV